MGGYNWTREEIALLAQLTEDLGIGRRADQELFELAAIAWAERVATKATGINPRTRSIIRGAWYDFTKSARYTLTNPTPHDLAQALRLAIPPSGVIRRDETQHVSVRATPARPRPHVIALPAPEPQGFPWAIAIAVALVCTLLGLVLGLAPWGSP